MGLRPSKEIQGTFPEKAEHEIFIKILEDLPDYDIFSGDSAPNFFVVYAHDNPEENTPAFADFVKDLIRWFGMIGAKCLADTSPQPAFASRRGGDAPSRNIVDNQLCLLPKDSSLKRKLSVNNVDRVLLCGSPLLEMYFHDNFSSSYMNAIKVAYGACKATNCDTIEARMRSEIGIHAACPGFHHVLTELAFLALRHSVSGNSDDIIPICLDGNVDSLDYLGLLPGTALRLKSSSSQEGLRRLFFKILRHLYHHEDRFIAQIQHRYDEACGMLHGKERISPEDIAQMSHEAIRKIGGWQNSLAKARRRELERVEDGNALCETSASDNVSDTALSACLMSLSFREMDNRSHEIERATHGTCTWLPEHRQYRQWSSTDRGVLWINGNPGTGKSTLLMFARDYVMGSTASDRSLILSFFFHGRGTDLQKTPLGLYRTLLHQLQGVPDSLKPVVDIYRQRCKGSGEPGQGWDWSLNQLRDLFRQCLLRALETHDIWLFLDALDECDNGDPVQLFHDLRDLPTALEPSQRELRVCFTSRHYPFSNETCQFQLCLQDQNTEDIRTYVRRRLVRGDLLSLQDLITERANHVFMWARLVIDRVLKLDNDGEDLFFIRKSIDEVPKKLEDLYAVLIEGADAKALVLFEWICFAYLPLDINELRWALMVHSNSQRSSVKEIMESDNFVTEEPDRLERKIRALSRGLAEVTKGQTVQFVHQSVQDFFRKRESLRAGDQEADWQGLSHLHISKACMRYLALDELVQYVQDLDFESGYTDRLSEDIREVVSKDLFPLSEYAAVFGPIHAKHSEVRGICQHDILTLCTEPFLQTWAQLFFLFRGNHRGETLDRTKRTTTLHFASMCYLFGVLHSCLQPEGLTVAEISMRDGVGRTPLSYAAGMGQLEVILALLGKEEGILQPNEGQLGSAMINLSDQALRTPLFHAAHRGHVDAVEVLLNSGADPNIAARYGRTALHEAARDGSAAIAQLLIKSGANINAVCKHKNEHWHSKGNQATALYLAARGGHKAVVQLLVDSGASVDTVKLPREECLNPLIGAAFNGSSDVVEVLLASGARVDASDGWGRTALVVAAVRGDHAIVEQLLEGDTDPDAIDSSRDTALFRAVKSFSFGLPTQAAIRLLIRSGASIDALGTVARAYLLMALHDMQDVSTTLLEWMASSDERDVYGRTVYDIVVSEGYDDLAQLLQQAIARDDAVVETES